MRRLTQCWKRVLGVALLALLVAVAIVVSAGADPSVTLPDGRELRIRAVTLGTHHTFAVGNPAARALAGFLPRAWAERLGVRVATHDTETECLMFWCEWSGATATRPAVRWASVFDGDGAETDPAHWKASLHPKGRTIYGWEFSSFPRRKEVFGLRVYDRDNAYVAHRVAELKVKNPGPTRHPQWSPLPLPRERTNEGFLIRLASLETREDLVMGREFWGRIAPWSIARFEVERDGVELRSWKINRLELIDAAGNHALQEATHYSQGPGELEFVFNSVVWPGEAALKLRVGFVRGEGFPPESQYTIRSLAIPPVGGVTAIETRTNLQGMNLFIEELARPIPGAVPGRSAKRGEVAEVRAQLLPSEPSAHLTLLTVQDQDAVELPVTDSRRLPNSVFQFVFRLGAASRELTFVFAVHRDVTVEFDRVPPPIR